MEDLHNLHEKSVDSSVPHRQINVFGPEVGNYKSPTKRYFLNECIEELYIRNEYHMSNISIPVEYNKDLIWNMVNNLIRPPTMLLHEEKVEGVKRRLFWATKQRLRKCKRPQLNKCKRSEAFHFKPVRHVLGIKKIRRNYLERARRSFQIDYRQMLIRQLAEQGNSESMESYVHISTSDGIIAVPQRVFSQMYHYYYHGNMAPQHPQVERSMEEQIIRERCTAAYTVATEKVIEATIRSLLYTKVLMGPLLHQEDDQNLNN